MKAIILAAGRGKRMRYLTKYLPKPLLRVNGKTFLDIIFDALPAIVNEVIIVIGYQGEKIKAYLGENYKGRKIHYVIQQELNGTGNAVLLTKNYFESNEQFLIFYGDEIVNKKEVEGCIKNAPSWLCWEVVDPKASGIVTLSQDGFIAEIVEKPKNPTSKLGAAGLMAVNADIFDYTPEQHQSGEYYLTSMMNKFVKTHKVLAVIGFNRPSFSTPEDINKART